MVSRLITYVHFCKKCYPRVTPNILLIFEKWWYMGMVCLPVYSYFRPHFTFIIRKIVGVFLIMTWTLTYAQTIVHICIRISFYNQNRIGCDLSKLVLCFQIASREFCKRGKFNFESFGSSNQYIISMCLMLCPIIIWM